MIKFDLSNENTTTIETYNFEDSNHYIGNIFNGISDFKAPFNNQLIIGENSQGIQKANTQASSIVPYDILGIERAIPADIGAYQHIIFEN